jgi:alkanesulfonate monooxygenase SsuD/methylene tetrahydromethanopterin reductase-like flavin-dependent oxidoreductase (luciferase family)
MLRLTAQYADLWNPAVYLSAPHSLAEPQARLHTACTEVGRDPATLGVTGVVALAYPDLGAPPPSPLIPAYLAGTTEEIAATIQGYAQLGVTHLIFNCVPHNATTLGRLGEAVQLYRRQAPGH